MNYKTQLQSLEAAVSFVDGAIIIDEFDDQIFDDVMRDHPAWGRIDKRPAPGETTGGFDQTAVGAARAADPRSLGFTATSPTRVERTRRTIKAIVTNRDFTIFDRSVGMQQNRPFSDLTDKDVKDMNVACMDTWNTNFYEGVASSTEYDGLRTLLAGDIRTIAAASSVANGLDDIILEMVNRNDRAVRPTGIYTNAKVVQFLVREFESVGDKLLTEQILVNGSPRQIFMLPTSIGMIPLFADVYNSSIAGSPVLYPTFILTENLVSWQYVKVLGNSNPEPRTFEIALANDLDQEFSAVMFGAVELLGGTVHHKYVSVESRSTVVSPV